MAALKWNFRSMLDVDPDNDRTCVGEAKLEGRKCEIKINPSDGATASRLLDQMDRLDSLLTCVPYLRDLAALMLCKGMHNNKKSNAYLSQVDEVEQKWFKIVVQHCTMITEEGRRIEGREGTQKKVEERGARLEVRLMRLEEEREVARRAASRAATLEEEKVAVTNEASARQARLLTRRHVEEEVLLEGQREQNTLPTTAPAGNTNGSESNGESDHVEITPQRSNALEASALPRAYQVTALRTAGMEDPFVGSHTRSTTVPSTAPRDNREEAPIPAPSTILQDYVPRESETTTRAHISLVQPQLSTLSSSLDGSEAQMGENFENNPQESLVVAEPLVQATQPVVLVEQPQVTLRRDLTTGTGSMPQQDSRTSQLLTPPPKRSTSFEYAIITPTIGVKIYRPAQQLYGLLTPPETSGSVIPIKKNTPGGDSGYCGSPQSEIENSPLPSTSPSRGKLPRKPLPIPSQINPEAELGNSEMIEKCQRCGHMMGEREDDCHCLADLQEVAGDSGHVSRLRSTLKNTGNKVSAKWKRYGNIISGSKSRQA